MAIVRQAPDVPHHIAIVMDGNGRWAKKRFMPRLAGHKQGLEALKKCIQHCGQRGVKVLTVFAFSSENWNRPTEEVNGLFELFAKALSSEVPDLSERGLQLHFVGDIGKLTPDMQSRLMQAQAQTAHNHALILNVCFSYGGRWDMVQAAQQIQRQNLDMSEENIERFLALSHVAHPDLLIRTGGEQRLSNFLLWQAAYSECYFSNTLWPDFDDKDLDAALAHYAQRERRFGQTSEQLATSAKSA